MNQQNSETLEQRERKKKFLLILPVLIIAIAATGFAALGGGKGDAGEQAAQQKGINTELPSAQFKGEKQQDKLSLYDQAAKDSARARMSAGNSLFAVLKKDSAKTLTASDQSAKANEAQINKKLAQLRQQINQPSQSVNQVSNSVHTSPAVNSAEVDRLEKLMQNMKSGNNSDPEMKQLDGMITKILQIQHPELVNEQLKKEVKPEPDSVYKAIRAVIANSQKVVSGASVKLKLLDTIKVNGQTIPKGQYLFGLCQVNNQRLILNIKNIRLGTSIVPVDLSVYDMDGMVGINAPDAVTEGAVRSGSDNALQSMQFLPMDETLGTQAASAGIETAKGLFSKKVKVVKVKLKAGYPVLLRLNKK
ncbi:conjugative transposon protein TraM [Mucilaginibacter sp. X4EP1]|uniref:conjugative transposon protein TraM n=1 Tax=Mucilaginibacter sp. X4EP1 TaxID=2723092 RepID=UPI0021691C6B|nr:conjugative transposon protein TraM [Mucilaginibacter sp. X4EP1]MCS3815471.1 hypothetical protein [Mucilaginibacter sp. X4EP1]